MFVIAKSEIIHRSKSKKIDFCLGNVRVTLPVLRPNPILVTVKSIFCVNISNFKYNTAIELCG